MIDISGMQHLFLEDSSLPHALLLITSDIGFLGKLNIAVVNTALEQSSEKDELIIVGKQGARYIDETSRNLTSFAGISDEVKYEEAEGLADFILKGIFGQEILQNQYYLSPLYFFCCLENSGLSAVSLQFFISG